MLEFIPVKNTELLQKYDIKLEDLGKSAGFMGCGRKIYLVFDQKKMEWGVTRLDVFHRILRYFGFYKATYKETVRESLIKNPCVIKNDGFTKRVKDIWGIHFPPDLPEIKPPIDPEKDKKNKTEDDESLSDQSSIYSHDDDSSLEDDEDLFNLLEIYGPGNFSFGEFDENSDDESTRFSRESDLTTEELLENTGNIFKKDVSGIEKPVKKHPVFIAPPVYEQAHHRFWGLSPQAKILETQYKKSLPIQEKLNIEKSTLFGNWVEMGWNSTVETVLKGPEFQILEKIAKENQELGNYLFLGIRGDGRCGYRAILSSLIHNDCILNDNVEALQNSFIQAFNDLNPYWKTLFKDHPEAKRFEISKEKVFKSLESMNDLNREKRIEKLRDETYLEPFFTFIRCLVVSQIQQFDISPPAQLDKSDDEYINVESFQANLFSNHSEADELGIKHEEFLKRKGVGDDGTITSYWLSASDQDLIGYALKKNICCIWGDRKAINYDTNKIFPNKKPDFYTMNLNVKHYYALVPTFAEVI